MRTFSHRSRKRKASLAWPFLRSSLRRLFFRGAEAVPDGVHAGSLASLLYRRVAKDISQIWRIHFICIGEPIVAKMTLWNFIATKPATEMVTLASTQRLPTRRYSSYRKLATTEQAVFKVRVARNQPRSGS